MEEESEQVETPAQQKEQDGQAKAEPEAKPEVQQDNNPFEVSNATPKKEEQVN